MPTIPKLITVNEELLATSETAEIGAVVFYDGERIQWVARPESKAYLVTKTADGFSLDGVTADLGKVNLGQSLGGCVRCNDESKRFRDSLVEITPPDESNVYLGLISPLGREIGWATLSRTFGTDTR